MEEKQVCELRSMNKLERMQQNLYLVRGAMGWTQRDLADKLGLSRTSMSALENTHYKLSMVYYLAITKLVVDECRISDDDGLTMAKTILSWLVQEPTMVEDEDLEKLLMYANMFVPAALCNGLTRKLASDGFVTAMKSSGLESLLVEDMDCL